MSTSHDISSRAQAMLEKVADRLPNLPKPVLAAIGAADLAGRQLTELLNRIGEKSGGSALTSKLTKLPDRDEVVDELRQTAADLPGRVQQVAADLPEKVSGLVAELPAKAKEFADQLERAAGRLPGQVQKLTDELPGKVSEVTEQLQPDQLKASAEAYRQLISTMFDSLAERGGKAWSEIRNSGPATGAVVDAPVAQPPAQAKTAARPARRAPAAASSTTKATGTKAPTTTGAAAASAAAKTRRTSSSTTGRKTSG